MKKFLAVYMAPIGSMDEMMKNMTPEMQKSQNGVWMAWMEKNKGMMSDMGAPLGKNKRVTKEGVSDVRNEMGGYTIVQAETHDEAAQMFMDNPMMQMPGAYVEVLEIMPMPQ
jgi:leucyl aminopeptidase (aminopeptidase T)